MRAAGSIDQATPRGDGITLGDVRRALRPRVDAILRATGVFSDAELGVALELFDSVFADGDERASDHPDYSLIGAYEDASGDLLGYACYGATPCTSGTYDLYWIAVDPTRHNMGVGAALLREIESRLRARGARLIVAETSSREPYGNTRAFYERRGFVRAAVVHDYYAAGDHQVVYIRRLDEFGLLKER